MEQENQQTLLSEGLTDEEVQDILERLTERELGESHSATVGAVMEATGADYETVTRILRELRTENKPRSADSVDEKPDAPATRDTNDTTSTGNAPRNNRLEVDEYYLRTLRRLADQESRKDDREKTGRIFVATLALSLVLSVGVLCPKGPTTAHSIPFSPQHELLRGDGSAIFSSSDERGILVREANGTIRNATESESAQWRSSVNSSPRDRATFK